MHRLWVVITAILILNISSQAFDVPTKLTKRFDGRTLTPIEGVWLWNNGALVSIAADSRGQIVLTLEDSPDPFIVTPVVIGTGKFGGIEGTYDVELKVSSNLSERKNKFKKARFILKLTDKGRLSLSPYSTGLKINAWRLIPYLFRFSVSENKEPNNKDGAIRVWPPYGSPEFPIIL